MTISVGSPEGRTWRVSRRLLPWHPVVRDIDAFNRYASEKVTFVDYLLHGPIFWVLYPVVLVFRFLLTYGRAPGSSAVRYTGVARGRDGTERLIDTVAAEIAVSGVLPRSSPFSPASTTSAGAHSRVVWWQAVQHDCNGSES